MRLVTILHRLYRHKGFVYGPPGFVDEGGRPAIRVPVRPRKGNRPICSGCQQRGPGYDRQPERFFQFVPLWGMAVFLAYRMRRVACPRCGVTVECVPWARGKERQTEAFAWFLTFWAKLLTWQQVAETFGVSWGTVFAAVERGVEWGLARRQLDGIRAIGVDEVQWQRGHRYLTLVYQIEDGCKRLLYVGLERTADSLRGFFESVSTQVAAGLKYVCSDMWQPYLEVLAERAAQAVHVLDRYHLVARLNKAVDEVRAEEARRLKADGYEPVLKHSRWCLLKRPANLTDQQTVKLRELLKYNLRSVRAYLHKEDLQRLWEYHAPFWAGKFLGEWIRRVLRSRLEPMKKVARSMRNHMGLILNWFEARGTISAGSVEGKNYQVKLAMKNAYGFRTFRAIEIALFHKLGALPESELTHRFV
jgi:transposase